MPQEAPNNQLTGGNYFPEGTYIPLEAILANLGLQGGMGQQQAMPMMNGANPMMGQPQMSQYGQGSDMMAMLGLM